MAGSPHDRTVEPEQPADSGLEGELRSLAERARDADVRMRDLGDALRHARAKLREAERRAQIAERLKSEFLLNMTHELRTPMTAIVGFSGLLSQEALPPTAAAYVDAVWRNAERLNGLLEDVFDLSLLEAGEFDVSAQTFCPYDLVQALVAELLPEAQDEGIGVETSVIGAIPVRVRSDPERLRRILRHLVRNGIRYTSEGGVRVLLRMQDGADGPRLRIDVVDTGRGLSPEKLSQVFEPFARGDEHVVRHSEGAGLGLTVAHQMARVLGGKLSGESIEGHGSVFRLEIDPGDLTGVPMLEYASESPGEIDDATTRTLRTLARTADRARRVLYVEDGRDNQRLVRLLLERAGFEVTCADDGRIGVRAALESRTATPYDLVLMDLQMPEVDGYEATEQLRAAAWSGPIIALTAHAMKHERERALAAGCDQFLTKPIDRRELLSAIRRALSVD